MSNSANVGFEKELFKMADKLRNNMDAGEYKHVVLELFYSTGIPACLWILAQNKSHEKHRNRKGETLFIDARNLGNMVTRKHRELSDEEIKSIADTYHAYRNLDGEYEDIKGLGYELK